MSFLETVMSQVDIIIVLVCSLTGIGVLFGAKTAVSTLRGKLVSSGLSSRRPARGIAVTVYRPDIGRSVPVYTGKDGMFSLTVPSGKYTLEVWFAHDSEEPPMKLYVEVRDSCTDLPPIRLPQSISA